MSHKLNQIIKIVAGKCKYLLKIYIYDKKIGPLAGEAAVFGWLCRIKSILMG